MNSVELFDTQIISYAFKGIRELPTASTGITSITAQEFLLMQTSEPNRNAYYLPHSSLLMDHPAIGLVGKVDLKRFVKEHGGFKKRHTDTFIIELPRPLPAVVEYSHAAITNALNTRSSHLVKAAVEVLPKKIRPIIRHRLEFLLDSGVRCYAFGPAAAPLTAELVDHFITHHQAKKNFRNTLNDIASFAVTALAELDFHTDDRLLARFIADMTRTTLIVNASEAVLHFRNRPEKIKRNEESRRYINRPRILREGPQEY